MLMSRSHQIGKTTAVTFALLAVQGCVATARKVSQETVSQPPVYTQPGIFYKAFKENKTLYFYGSVHLGAKDFYPLPQTVMSAFQDSKKTMFEIDFSSQSVISSLQTYGEELIKKLGHHPYLLPEGKKISDGVTPETLQKFTAIVAQKKEIFSPAAAQRVLGKTVSTEQLPLKYYQYQLLMQVFSQMNQKYGYSAENGIDTYFFKLSEKNKKQIIPLELLSDQMRMLQSFDSENPETAMRSFIHSAEVGFGGVDQTALMVAAWRSGNVSAAQDLFNIEADNFKKSGINGYLETLLYSRNREMVKKISSCPTVSESCFVVIGFGHLLFDEQSVPGMLRKDGYEVTRL